MTKSTVTYVILWQVGEKTKRTDSTSERRAKRICAKRSREVGMSQYAEVVDGIVARKCTYENGTPGPMIVGTGEAVNPINPDGTYTKPDAPAPGHGGGIASEPDEGSSAPAAVEAPKAKRRSKIADGIKQPRPIETKRLSTIDKRVRESIQRQTKGILPPTTEEEVLAEIELTTTSPVTIAASAKRISAGLSPDEVVAQFKPRNGTIRKKLIETLVHHLDKPISTVDLATTLYGEFKPQFVGPLKMVMKGVHVMIAKEKLPYAVKQMKAEGEPAYMLTIA